MRSGSPFLFLSLLFATPSFPQERGSIEDSCYTEIHIFCQSAGPKHEQILRCLDQYHDILLPSCKTALKQEAADKLTAQQLAAEAEGTVGKAEDIEARLTKVEGTVYIHTSQQKEGEFIKAEADIPLASGDLVRTGTDGRAEVAFEGNSILQLDNGTDFIVNSLQPAHTEAYLGIGSLIAKLQKLLTGRSLSFRTPTAVASVRGTELAVSQEDSDKPTRIGVFDEGQVAVSSLKGGRQVLLKPGQETSVTQGKPPEKPKPLATFAPQKQAIQQVRQRVEAVKKTWVSQPPQARDATRAKLSMAKSIAAQNLNNVKPSQKTLTHADAFKRQAQLLQQSQNGTMQNHRQDGSLKQQHQSKQNNSPNKQSEQRQRNRNSSRGEASRQQPQGRSPQAQSPMTPRQKQHPRQSSQSGQTAPPPQQSPNQKQPQPHRKP